jgi:hypothetical protein
MKWIETNKNLHSKNSPVHFLQCKWNSKPREPYNHRHEIGFGVGFVVVVVGGRGCKTLKEKIISENGGDMIA